MSTGSQANGIKEAMLQEFPPYLDAADFIVQELGVDTPWHISRFHPAYRMTKPDATPLPKIEEASAIGREAGLRYVYPIATPFTRRKPPAIMVCAAR